MSEIFINILWSPEGIAENAVLQSRNYVFCIILFIFSFLRPLIPLPVGCRVYHHHHHPPVSCERKVSRSLTVHCLMFDSVVSVECIRPTFQQRRNSSAPL